MWQFALIYLLWPSRKQLKKEEVYEKAREELYLTFNTASETKKQEA